MKQILILAFLAAVCYISIFDQAEAQDATTIATPSPKPLGRLPKGGGGGLPTNKGKGGKKPRQTRSPSDSFTVVETYDGTQAIKKIKDSADQIKQVASEIMNKTMKNIKQNIKKVSSGSISVQGQGRRFCNCSCWQWGQIIPVPVIPVVGYMSNGYGNKP